MAEKKGQIIVIKKVYVNAAGHHGGSWKVALADFMTAMMAFFLVMWLVGQNDQTKKAIADYFSKPSMIEYNYETYGAEITLEKLFMDLMNEPLRAVQSFVKPPDDNANALELENPKIINSYLFEQLSEFAKNVTVNADGFEFDIPDYVLFEKGTAKPSAQFVPIMDKITRITRGIKDAKLQITAAMFVQAVADQLPATAQQVADERFDVVKARIASSFEVPTVEIIGGPMVRDKKGETDPKKLVGFIKIKMIRKTVSTNQKPGASGTASSSSNAPAVDRLVKELGDKKRSGRSPKEIVDEELSNPVKTGL